MSDDKDKANYSVGLLDDEHLMKLIHEAIDPWCKKVETEIIAFMKDQKKNDKAIARHAKQVDQYLAGFNKILREKL